MRTPLPHTAIACILAVLVLATGLFFYRLGAEPFQDYDEATYAEVVHEGIQQHDLLGLHFLDVNYFRKPPLLFWLMEGSQATVGMFTGTNSLTDGVELADRLPSAIAGFATIVVVMLIVYAVTGNGYAAAFGGGALLATAAFVEPARQVRFDVLASLFDMLALYAFIQSRKNPKWLIWLGAFLGLAIMAKGPLVLYAVGAIICASIGLKDWKWATSRYFFGGLALMLAIVLPWHVYETIRFGLGFWHEYVGVQVLERVAQPLFMVSTTNTSYFLYMAGVAAPWTELFFAAFIAWAVRAHIIESTSRIRPWIFASIGGVVTVLAICLWTSTKAISYLIPLYPFLIVGMTLCTYSLFEYTHKVGRMLMGTIAIASLIGGIWLTTNIAFHKNPGYVDEVVLANQEHQIGTYLAHTHASNFSVYNTTTLGNIMFYSRLLHPAWLSSMPPVAGTYVLYQTAEKEKLEAAYPSVRFEPVAGGSFVTLAVVFAS